MKNGVGQFIAAGTLIILSTLFIPQGISEFATAAALNEPVPTSAGPILGIGGLMVLVAVILLARGYAVRHKNLNTTRTYDTEDPEDFTRQRPTFGYTNRPAWMDRPDNHMGDNPGRQRD